MDLPSSIGHLLEQASSALRTAMEDVLRPLDTTVTHYSCRVLPVSLTPLGRERLAEASAAVRRVEQRMLSGLDEREQDEARRLLRGFTAALSADD